MNFVVENWWTTLRLPLAGIVAVIWFFLLQRRTVDINQDQPPEAVKVEATSSTKPADAPEELNLKPATKSKAKKPPKKFTRALPEQIPPVTIEASSPPPEIHIFYASQFNHTATLAKHLLTLVSEYTRLHDISVIPNLDDYFLQHPSNAFYFLLLPSYANDSGPTQSLIEALEETLNDFRVDANPLQKLAGFAVFGTGDKEGWPGKKEYCYQAATVEKLMERLGARRVFNIGMGDTKGRISLESQMEGWAKHVLNTIQNPITTTTPITPEPTLDESEESDEETETPLLDVEDIGPVAQRHKRTPTDFTPKPMVSKSSTTYAALTKQGYTIVGSHSGRKNLSMDKICPPR